MLAGYAPLFNATAGVFVRPLAAEFGWGRSQASLSYAASMFGLAIVESARRGDDGPFPVFAG
ncbi:hypothetical protein ACTMU2_13480 [Cupriavidus basilensis]